MEKRSELPCAAGRAGIRRFVYTTPKKNLEASNFTGGVADSLKIWIPLPAR